MRTFHSSREGQVKQERVQQKKQQQQQQRRSRKLSKQRITK